MAEKFYPSTTGMPKGYARIIEEWKKRDEQEERDRNTQGCAVPIPPGTNTRWPEDRGEEGDNSASNTTP